MGANEAPFVWSDAWVLLSLIYARVPSTRPHLRSVGDHINHAVFTEEELEGGIQRLQAAGYATEENDLIQPTQSVLTWYDNAGSAKRRYVRSDMKRVEMFLGLRP